MPKDSCYHSVKARYDVFPSARASQAIAKCRKGKGAVRKTSKGNSLKRWQKEKWTDTKTGKACGAGGSNEYCRPKNKVSSKTPKTIGEMSKSELKRKKAEKSKVGMGRRVTSLESLDEIFEFGSAAWTRKEGKRASGGLNQKGVESYRRENPGSKLKTAVTRDPSKLKKGGKAAKRRASFCARMKGMKKRRTSAKTANDPNSRINKSLRAWNC